MRLKNKQKNLVQWDKGQILIVDESPPGTIIHFYNIKSKKGYVLQTDGNSEVQFPDILLQQPYPITAWIYKRDADRYYAENRREFQVIRRPRPEDYIYDDEERMYWDSKIDKHWDPSLAGRFLIVGEDGDIIATDVPIADKYLEFLQVVPSDQWYIVHNLDKNPSVTVNDSAGTTVVGEIEYLNSNSLIISFQAPFSGKAYLN